MRNFLKRNTKPPDNVVRAAFSAGCAVLQLTSAKVTRQDVVASLEAGGSYVGLWCRNLTQDDLTRELDAAGVPLAWEPPV